MTPKPPTTDEDCTIVREFEIPFADIPSQKFRIVAERSGIKLQQLDTYGPMKPFWTTLGSGDIDGSLMDALLNQFVAVAGDFIPKPVSVSGPITSIDDLLANENTPLDVDGFELWSSGEGRRRLEAMDAVIASLPKCVYCDALAVTSMSGEFDITPCCDDHAVKNVPLGDEPDRDFSYAEPLRAWLKLKQGDER